jgi:hypothetical protein
MKKLGLVIIFLFSFQSLWAFGWPVIDFEAIIEDVKIYDSNMQILRNGIQQLNTAKNTLENAKAELTSMTEISTYSNLLNSPEDLENRLYTAQSWQAALDGQSSNAQYKNILNGYSNNHPAVTAKEYLNTHTQEQFKQYDEHQKTVKTAAATSQNEYTNTDKYIKNINEIGKEASSDKNDGVKTAIDLNTRMEEQLGYLLVSQIRLQSVKNNLESSNTQEDIDKQKIADEFYANKDI